MIERLTDRTRRVVALAEQEARERRAGEVRTEHLLLGLIREPRNLSHRVFERFGAPPDALRAAVDALEVPRGAPDATAGPLPFDRGAEAALELALGEALRMGMDYVGCEYLLLGMLHHGGAAHVLGEFDIELQSSRAVVEELVRGRRADRP